MNITSLLCWPSFPLSSTGLSAASFINRFWLANCPVGFPHGSDGKESACNAGDPGSAPGSGRSPEEGNGYTLQYSYLGNPSWTEEPGGLQSMGSESDTTEQLSLINYPAGSNRNTPVNCFFRTQPPGK